MVSNNIYRGSSLRKAFGILALILLLVGSADAATLTVNASGGADYKRIQDAIDNAGEADTILVYSGTYYENVIINRQLILRRIDIGSSMPVVDAHGAGNAITITADGVVLDGFNAHNSSSNTGIEVVSSNNVINNNSASNNYYGIHLEGSSNNMLNGNNISNNQNGIYLVYGSSNNKLSGNNASNNKVGINLYYSYKNIIYNNYFSNTYNAFDNRNNLWNIPKRPGTNIINGQFLGGNFWSDYTGNDTDGDGLGDTRLPYTYSGGIERDGDDLPLVAVSSLGLGAPNITSFSPIISTVTNNMGDLRIFKIKVNRTVNIIWRINGTKVQTNKYVTTASYTNISAARGIWNVTAVASNSNSSAIHTWIWNVTQPIIGNGSISGIKFNDSNGNGRKDIGESTLSNWTIVLKNRNGSIVKTMMTDLNGNYTFGGLEVGNYSVEEVLQVDWTQTFPQTRIYNLTLAAGENMTGIDFGNYLIPPQPSMVNAKREIDKESLGKGESTNITIRINSNVIQALDLQEVIPSGWKSTRISDDADGFKKSTNEWVWSNMTPGITKTVIYSITAPTGAAIGTYYINGTISSSTGIIAVVGGDNVIKFDILAYYRRLGSDSNIVETTDLLKAMDDWRSRTVPAGFINPITNQELLALINEWTSS